MAAAMQQRRPQARQTQAQQSNFDYEQGDQQTGLVDVELPNESFPIGGFTLEQIANMSDWQLSTQNIQNVIAQIEATEAGEDRSNPSASEVVQSIMPPVKKNPSSLASLVQNGGLTKAVIRQMVDPGGSDTNAKAQEPRAKPAPKPAPKPAASKPPAAAPKAVNNNHVAPAQKQPTVAPTPTVVETPVNKSNNGKTSLPVQPTPVAVVAQPALTVNAVDAAKQQVTSAPENGLSEEAVEFVTKCLNVEWTSKFHDRELSESEKTSNDGHRTPPSESTTVTYTVTCTRRELMKYAVSYNQLEPEKKRLADDEAPFWYGVKLPDDKSPDRNVMVSRLQETRNRYATSFVPSHYNNWERSAQEGLYLSVDRVLPVSVTLNSYTNTTGVDIVIRSACNILNRTRTIGSAAFNTPISGFMQSLPAGSHSYGADAPVIFSLPSEYVNSDLLKYFFDEPNVRDTAKHHILSAQELANDQVAFEIHEDLFTKYCVSNCAAFEGDTGNTLGGMSGNNGKQATTSPQKIVLAPDFQIRTLTVSQHQVPVMIMSIERATDVMIRYQKLVDHAQGSAPADLLQIGLVPLAGWERSFTEESLDKPVTITVTLTFKWRAPKSSPSKTPDPVLISQVVTDFIRDEVDKASTDARGARRHAIPKEKKFDIISQAMAVHREASKVENVKN